MAGTNDVRSKSTDPAVQEMIAKAAKIGIKTVWDRYEAMQPQCGFGDTGLCCRHCLQGPCRIDPFGEGPTLGICGATADTMVARGLDRAIAAGTAAHSGHAKHLAHTLLKLAKGQTTGYSIKEVGKLRAVATRMSIPVNGRSDNEVAMDLANAALADFHEKDTPVLWAATVVNSQRAKVLTDLGLVPKGIDHEVSEIMHRTLYGVDADPVNLLLGGMRCAVADLAGCYMATDIADILFGIPQPRVTEANLGTLKAGAVNIALHGHNPVLSDVLVTRAETQEWSGYGSRRLGHKHCRHMLYRQRNHDASRYSSLHSFGEPGNGHTYGRVGRHGRGLPVYYAFGINRGGVYGHHPHNYDGYRKDPRRNTY